GYLRAADESARCQFLRNERLDVARRTTTNGELADVRVADAAGLIDTHIGGHVRIAVNVDLQQIAGTEAVFCGVITAGRSRSHCWRKQQREKPAASVLHKTHRRS